VEGGCESNEWIGGSSAREIEIEGMDRLGRAIDEDEWGDSRGLIHKGDE
jgi:hypothetical protein